MAAKRSASPTRFPIEQSVPISSNTFRGTSFLEKGPPKITEGGPFDPH